MNDKKDNKVSTTLTKMPVHWGKILPAAKHAMSLIKLPNFEAQIIYTHSMVISKAR